jgi:hypothetical protein
MDATAFQHAINLGLGRAYLLLTQEPTAYDAILTNACLHNKSYDPQVEGSRAGYLLDLMDASRSFPAISESIVDSLNDEAEGWDFWQRLRLTRMLAQRGSMRARAAMKIEFMGHHADMREQLSLEVVELDGIEGLLAAVRQIGAWIETTEDAWDDGSLIDIVSDEYGKQTVELALGDAAKADPTVQVYLDAIEKHQAKRNPVAPLEKTVMSYAEIQDLIASGNAAGMIARWSKRASDSELLTAAQDLIDECEMSRLRSYLLIFRNRKFPLALDRLFELAQMADGPIPRHALLVLANISDTRVRDLALTLANSGSDLRSFAVDLLAHNFMDGDHVMMEGWFDRENDLDVLQGLNLGLLNFYRLHPNLESEARLLEKLYDRLPCAHCRCSLVERLLEMGRFSNSLKQECKYDSYLETRALVQRNHSPKTIA